MTRRAAALLLAVLLAACGGPAPTATPSPAASAPASPAASGEAAAYDLLEGQVRAIRGLEPPGAVSRAVLDEDAVRAHVVASLDRDNDPAEVAAGERLLKGLLLLPADASLRDLWLDLLTSQVLGLYDDVERRMYVVARDGEIGPLERTTYAHEYVHALQDATWTLATVVRREAGEDDRALAALALVEGDATLTMALWAQQHLTREELAEVVAAGEGPAGSDVLARTPAILRETLTFPYTAGLQLVLATRLDGGWAAVDALYRTPPVSTEQVLHPEKRAAGEAPLAVPAPAGLAAALGSGWTTGTEAVMGEFQLGIWLREAAGRITEQAEDAAAGWGGDRAVLLDGPGGAYAVALDTRWDDAAEADEFLAAARAFTERATAAGRAAAVVAAGRARVLVLSAPDAATLARLRAALGA